MKALLNWLDTRTGVHHLMHEALYERVPGGARWRYVWGSTLVFAFITQAITGLFLWMCYSPSAQTAWESVYYIQFQMQGGWLLRGIHHFMAQAMIVLMALHLMQVVIDGAYRAPREVNFWLGLVLMQIVLGLSLTGYLLPWDQKGYWATRVATNLLSIVPVVGPQLQQLVVGGSDYGHHTLTRFFALHAGLLPALLVAALVPHVALFRRHGLCARHPLKGPETTFWPDQVLKDGVACLAVLIVVLVLVVHPLDHFFASGADSHAVAAGAHLGAELGAPADSSEQYSAARPEWYFLFLFQFLKLFEGWGEHGELLGAIVIPGAVMTALFFMPFIGRWKLGHGFNVGLLVVLFACIGLLTMAAMTEDYNALWTNESEFTDVPEILDKVGSDPQKIADYFNNDPARIAEFATQAKEYDHFAKSKSYLQAVKEAEREAERIVTLAASPSLIPSTGAITLLRNDPKTQGPKLFARNCAGCHAWQPPAGAPDDPQTPRDPSAPNLYGFASRAWIAGLLDPKKIEGPEYFGKTAHREGQMVGFVKENAHEWPASQVHDIVIALSAEAQLKSQLLVDQRDAALIVTGKALIAQEDRCVSCHKFGAAGELGAAPDLTNYGSRAWLIGMIRDPKHERYYRDENDRMPSFAAAPGDSEKNKLSEHAIGLIADWLRGTWYEPGDTVPATEVVASESAAEPHEKPAQPAAEVAPAESTPNDTPNPEPVTPDPKPETPPTEPTPKPDPTPTPEPAPKPEPTPPPDPKPAEPEPASKPPEPAPKPDDPSPPSAAS